MHRMPMALPAGGGAAERLPGRATRCLPVSTSTRYGFRRGPQYINSKNSKQCVWLFSTTNKPEKMDWSVNTESLPVFLLQRFLYSVITLVSLGAVRSASAAS